MTATLDARLDSDQVRTTYTRIASVYDVWAQLTESRARDAALRAAAVRDGEAVLEVAVGTGLLYEQLVRRNPNGRTDGIDLTPAMLARAERKVAGLAGQHRLQVGDARALPFPDATFDVVLNNYMFDLLPEDAFAGVLGEFTRVLRPGGRLVLVNMAHTERWSGHVWDWVYRVNPAWVGGCRGVALSPHLAAAGFEDIDRHYVHQLTFPSEVITARRPAA